MRRFRDLLAPDVALTPGEEQCRASEGLAHAVHESRLGWWKARQGANSQGQYLLLAVAPFSQYDLTLLDILDTLQSPLPIYVVNVQDYATAEQLNADFPGIGKVPQTPVVAHCDAGSVPTVACGRKGRDLLAHILGLSTVELSQKVAAESRSYVNSTARR